MRGQLSARVIAFADRIAAARKARQDEAVGSFCDVLPRVYQWLNIDAKRDTRLVCRKVRDAMNGLVVSVALHDDLAEGDFLDTADAAARARAGVACRFLAQPQALQALALTWEPSPVQCAHVAAALSPGSRARVDRVEVCVPTGLESIGPDMSLCLLAAFPGTKELAIRTERDPEDDWDEWPHELLGEPLRVDEIAFSLPDHFPTALQRLNLDLRSRACVGVFEALRPLADGLRILDVSVSLLERDTLHHVAQLTGLVELSLHTDYTDDIDTTRAKEGLAQLRRLVSLQKMELCLAGFDEDLQINLSITDVLGALAPMSGLQSIDVRSSVFEFGDGDFKTLLPAMTALTHLEFSIVSASKGDTGWEVKYEKLVAPPAPLGRFMAGLQEHGGIGKIGTIVVDLLMVYGAEEWAELGKEIARLPSVCLEFYTGLVEPQANYDHFAVMASALMPRCAANVQQLKVESKLAPLLEFDFTALRSIRLCYAQARDVRDLLDLRAPALAMVTLGDKRRAPQEDLFPAIIRLALRRTRPDGGASLVISVNAKFMNDEQLDALRLAVEDSGRASWVTCELW